MGQMLIRNLDDDIIADLKAKARERRTSAEEQARQALRAYTRPDIEAWLARADAVRKMNGPQRGPDSVELIRRGRDELDAKWR